MLIIIILLNMLLISSASFENKLNPNCKKCKWYMPNFVGVYESGRCRMFLNKDTNTYRNALQCRLNSSYCGMDGSFYDPALNLGKEKYESISELKNQIQHIEQFFNGEICEEKELNKLEAEINYIKQKIKILENKIKDKNAKN